MEMDDHTRLKALLVERSVRLGDFALAGGASSMYYVDVRRTTMSAEGQVLVGKLAWTRVSQRSLGITHVGGLTMGADPVAYAIAHSSWLDGHPVDAFSVRKKAKEHGLGQRIEGGLPSDAHCLVVDDVMTSGGSAMQAITAVRAHGATVAAVFTVVDREEGAGALMEAEGVPVLTLFTGRELLEAARESA
ncbi:MAG TPA: orotate phosphoribosyltransferase [Gemmatimonadetes bacterium]|nr:orotate phosphoribosyltransferase [Gemmatimonadota bacterium]|tara:strand:+ start:328 stop:897 length:570 start_codon:yes stop_codon:yes gene_type:complete